MWLHRYVGDYPFVASVVEAALCYGVALPVLHVWIGFTGGEWAAAVLLWLCAAVAYAVAIGFAVRAFREPMPTSVALLGAFDVFVVLLHGTAAFGLSLWALDGAVARDTWVTGIPPGTPPYAAFVGNFLFASMTVMTTAGWPHTMPRAGNAFGALWGISVGFTGLLWLGTFFVVIVGEVRRKDAKPSIQQPIREIVHSYVPEMVARHRRRARPAQPPPMHALGK